MSVEQVQVMIKAAQQSLSNDNSAPNDARQSIPLLFRSSYMSKNLEVNTVQISN
ncbi:hypothetical protein AHAS_Ahas16G0088700 [Arachis hypogaea]